MGTDGKSKAYRLEIDPEMCKGCELCVGVCPHHVLGMSSAVGAYGHCTAVVASAAACTGCLRCARACPDAAIQVFAEDGP